MVLCVVAAALLLTALASGLRSRTLEAAAWKPAGRAFVIDPGHGGEDGGAVGVSGEKESEINLAVALRLRDLLRLFGAEPIMVRQTDVSVGSDNAGTLASKKASDLRSRAELVNRTPGALLVSIHQNWFAEARYHGAQVFYADTPLSKSLARLLQQALREYLDPANHREIKPAETVYLMKHIQTDGVLIECGFLSNEEEEARLRTPRYQTQLAAVIASVLLSCLEDPV